MIAIDQANDSENYAVLIGIAAPDFQKTNAEADLRAMFEELREARSRLLRNQLDYRTAESRLLYVQGLLQIAAE